MLGKTSQAFYWSSLALDDIEQLVQTRGDSYEVLKAPFYFKKASVLKLHIELNSDDLGNIKPLEDYGDEVDSALSEIEEEKQEEPEE